MERRSRRRRRRVRAVVGLISGLILLIAAAVGAYFDFKPDEGTRWIVLLIPALPLAIWGCSNLAVLRGYSNGVTFALFLTSLLLSSFIGATQSHITVGFAFVFAGLM